MANLLISAYFGSSRLNLAQTVNPATRYQTKTDRIRHELCGTRDLHLLLAIGWS
jgi:hypothetical protein